MNKSVVLANVFLLVGTLLTTIVATQQVFASKVGDGRNVDELLEAVQDQNDNVLEVIEDTSRDLSDRGDSVSGEASEASGEVACDSSQSFGLGICQNDASGLILMP